MKRIGVFPGQRKFRDGSVRGGYRSREEWEEAIQRHRRKAHRGKVDPECAACREMNQRYRNDKDYQQ